MQCSALSLLKLHLHLQSTAMASPVTWVHVDVSPSQMTCFTGTVKQE